MWANEKIQNVSLEVSSTHHGLKLKQVCSTVLSELVNYFGLDDILDDIFSLTL